MAIIEFILPKMGESIMEATVLALLKKAGDNVAEDESVLEVATDKIDTEVPSIHAGVIKEFLVKVGDVVKIGQTVALIETGVAAVTPAEAPSAPQKETTEKQPEPQPQTITAAGTADTQARGNRFYSPLVLNIAAKENISMTELEAIPGTGKDGRVTKYDILDYLKSGKKAAATVVSPAQEEPAVKKETPAAEEKQPPVTEAYVPTDREEVIEMSRMRRMIADRMMESKNTSAHVTSWVECDVTEIISWKNKMKHEYMAKESVALTLTPIFIEALAKALKDYPLVNSSVVGNNIIVKKDINIGMAVALPDGNLIVPVIKNVDELNLVGLTKRVNEMAKRARENKLKPEELTGGTYSMSNIGSFGNVMGTPIIVQPQVAIMAFGTVQKKPAVVETPHGDIIAIRHLMYLSHSYDHRIIDGALGGKFVRKVADYLENFDITRKN